MYVDAVKTLEKERPEVLVTGIGEKISVPTWMKHFKARSATTRQLRSTRKLPQVTLVRATGPESLLDHQDFLDLLARKQDQTSGTVIIIEFKKAAAADAERLTRVLESLPHLSRVELAFGTEHAAGAMVEALVKSNVRERADRKQDTRDALRQIKTFMTATADLRSESGRLSAQRVAACFGLPAARLAALLGRKRQTISKTDDAESLQADLIPFERIARLRVVLSDAEFRKWLRMPNNQLDGETPLRLVEDGEISVVAELAEDMLTGMPT